MLPFLLINVVILSMQEFQQIICAVQDSCWHSMASNTRDTVRSASHGPDPTRPPSFQTASSPAHRNAKLARANPKYQHHHSPSPFISPSTRSTRLHRDSDYATSIHSEHHFSGQHLQRDALEQPTNGWAVAYNYNHPGPLALFGVEIVSVYERQLHMIGSFGMGSSKSSLALSVSDRTFSYSIMYHKHTILESCS
jgi:hypothetical protein